MSKTKKQIEFEDIQQVPLNLIQGQFVSRKHKLQEGVVVQPALKKYYELREISTDNGIYEKLVEVDYPITPDYVKSFANSTDYRNDIESALNSPAPGANLGDMTDLQAIACMDMSAVKELQEKLSARVKELQAVQLEQKNVQVDKETEDLNNG